MSRVHVTPAAAADVARIAQYTQQEWGVAQRRRYVRQLRRCLDLIGANPSIGVARDDLLPTCRTFHTYRHTVVYRVVQGRAEILRVLHDAVDLAAQLTSPG